MVEINLNIEDKDIAIIKDFLKGKETPQQLDDLVSELAWEKTRHLRKNRVKVYHQGCEYKEGDLIFKEYSGKLPVGAKKFIEMNRGVVLKVVGARTRFGLNEILLSYDGTSEFRRYIQYLERQKIELLLPHKKEKPCKKTEYLESESDPRTSQKPMIDRDFNILRKKTVSALNRISEVAFICGKLMLEENLKKIEAKVFDNIREFLMGNKKSESTEFLVENFAKQSPESPDFAAYCFSLNYLMQRDYKIDFQQTNQKGWGRWNLISVIYYLKKNAVISDRFPLGSKYVLQNRKNLLARRKKFEGELFPESNRFFLTQREVHSGAVRVKPGMFRFGDSIEHEALEMSSKKKHILYYYADDQIILGFHEYFESVKALQGMVLHMEQSEDGQFHFEVRTTKKGTIAEKVLYNKESRSFYVTEEKIASPVFVNKSVFLENDVFDVINRRLDEFRKAENLNQLMHKIFLEFGIKEKNYEIHILRLYNILDLILPVRLKTVEEIILANPEFIPSDKITGVFYLDSGVQPEIELAEQESRQELAVEEQKQIDEKKKEEISSELKHQEEIRKIREMRRKKREEEMVIKEQRLKQKQEPAVFAESAIEPDPGLVPESAEAVFTPKEKYEKSPAPKEPSRKKESEKAPKAKKRVESVEEEKLDMDEIKQEIQLEKLKEQVLKKKKDQEKKAEKKIAYKDNGGFGGALASQLDQLTTRQTEEEDSDKDE